MKQLSSARFSAGQVLVESLIAITVITIGLLGVFDLLSNSLSLNKVVGDRYIASNLAAEGIEVVKNLIDNNVLNGRAWNSGISPGVYEIVYNDTILARQISSNPDNCTTDFIRQNSNNFLTFNSATGLYAYGFEIPTKYKRVVCVRTLQAGAEIRVNSLIAWTGRGGGDFDVNLENHFFDWRL